MLNFTETRMLYRRSFEIEQRLETTLRLIRTGRFSTPKLASELHVSIPTVSRYVMALRDRGHDIQAKHEGETKGSMSTLDLREIEDCKIKCARKFFAKITSEQVKYDVVDNYTKLMELVK
jgi:biotin operon repressor